MATDKNHLPSPGSHFIPLAQAKEMTALYRTQKENILDPQYKDKDILMICETFNRDAFDALLAEQGSAGIRIYFGMKPDFQVRVIAVAVNVDGEDILPDDGSALETTGGKVVEEGQT